MIATIDDLFDVDYGQKEYEMKGDLEEGKTILISSSGEDNGCYGFFDIPQFYKAPFITVPRTGTIGEAFVQIYDCCANSDVLILIPKKKLSIEKLFQVAFQIRKNKWRYAYGRKITPERLRKQKIKLVANEIDFNKFSKEITPEEIKKREIQNSQLKLIKVSDLCNVSKVSALPQNALESGETPYITTTSKNNGVSFWADEKPNVKGKCLTVALNGSVGETFFQFNDFITSGDNAVLSLKEDYNPYLLIFIGSMIEREKWRYNYYHKMNLTKLKEMKIPIPFKNGKVDTDYIKTVVENSYGFSEIRNSL